MSILCHKCVTAINELTDYKMLFPGVVLQTVFVLFYRTLPCRLHQLYKRRASLTVLSLLHSVHPVSTRIQWGNLGRTSCVYGSLVKSKWLFDLLYKRVLWFRVLSYLNFSHILCIKFLFLEPLTFSEKSFMLWVIHMDKWHASAERSVSVVGRTLLFNASKERGWVLIFNQLVAWF